MNDLERGWVAGIFEGEGTFAANQNRWVASVSSTDEFVLRRLHEITGLGAVYGPYRYKYEYRGVNQDHHKSYWKWTIGDRNGIVELIGLIEPLMSPRRREKIEVVMNSLREIKGRGRRGPGIATIEDAREIRRLYGQGGISQRELATRYGVSDSVIHKVIKNRTWIDN